MASTSNRSSLFDIQVNGFAGVDFQRLDLSADEVRGAVDALASHQTLRFFPALITDDIESLARKFQNLERIRKVSPVVASALCGYHLEGPWLSPESGYRGAHDSRHLREPDVDTFQRLQDAAGGNIRLVTIAPELPGSIEFVSVLVQHGVQISLGHTNASAAQIDAAISVGARFCTHLGNGVPLELHRHDNIVHRLLARDELAAFFIPDGTHLPPSVLRNFYRAKPEGKAHFTTDCMAAAGAPPGRYTLGRLLVEVGDDRIVYAPDSKTFAGSALCPDEGVRNLEQWLGLDAPVARRLFSTAIADAFKIPLPSVI